MRAILVFIIVFGLLVFVHEFGHFYVAKKSGILVREFSIGMGPKLFQVHRSQTTYTVRWLPLGGYVRLAGSDDESTIDPGTNVVVQLDQDHKVKRIDASESDMPISGLPVQVIKADLVDALTITGYENGDEQKEITLSVDHDATIIDKNKTELVIAPRDTQFQQANVWQKLATNFAGPFMNILLGFVVFFIWTFTIPGPATTQIAQIVPNSPAAEAGIHKNDRFFSIDGQRTANFNDVVSRIDGSHGRKMVIKLKRGQQNKLVSLKAHKQVRQKQKVYEIGVVAVTDNSFGAKIKRGWDSAVYTTGMIFNAVGNLFRHFSLNKLSGPVGIYSQTSRVSQMGFVYLLEFLAMISINLGIVNLIPIPGLDGGKLLLNLIELVRGKAISEDHEAAVELAGFVLLLLLIIAVTGNDIYRYFIK